MNVTYELWKDDRKWHVWEGLPGTGWYARLVMSSPPVILKGLSEATVLAMIDRWARLLLAPPAAE